MHKARECPGTRIGRSKMANIQEPSTAYAVSPGRGPLITKIMIALLLVVAAFLTYAAMQPAMYQITRERMVELPPAALYAEVDDFRDWEAWSPWRKMDPEAKYTYGGAPSGKGAVMHWSGQKSGVGTAIITASAPNELIIVRLNSEKPSYKSNVMEIVLIPRGPSKTQMIWNMHGENNFGMRVMGTLMRENAKVAAQFEEGLASLEAVARAKSR